MQVSQRPSGIVLHVICRVAARDRMAFIELIRRHISQTEIKDGCNGYSFSIDIEDSGTFHIVEGWRDLQALEAHNASADFRETIEALTSRVQILSRDTQMYAVASHMNGSPMDAAAASA